MFVIKLYGEDKVELKCILTADKWGLSFTHMTLTTDIPIQLRNHGWLEVCHLESGKVWEFDLESKREID